MKPDNSDDRQISIPPRDGDVSGRPSDRDATARLMRDQIDKIYDQPHASTQPSVYDRTHDENTAHQQTSHEWQRYHSAWQQYYQQYYERYYLSQLDSHRKRAGNTPNQPTATTTAFPMEKEAAAAKTESYERNTNDIRSEVLDKVKSHAASVRKNRHFMPIASALIVMALFLVLQYNRVIVAQVKAYVSPGAVSPQNIIVDPNVSVNVGPEPKLVIPKINVEAPIVYGITSLADAPVQVGLKSGVVHYPIPGADSMPGEKGNMVILGHSSNDVFDDGDYKFIFVNLEQLQKGDVFYINNEGKRYTYSVTSKEVILPNQVSKLILPQEKPTATLVTCVPIGTALKRLVVYADQISPDPSAASASTGTPANAETTDAALPGYSPTFFERLFGS